MADGDSLYSLVKEWREEALKVKMNTGSRSYYKGVSRCADELEALLDSEK